MTGRSWAMVIACLLLAFVSLGWWQHVADTCAGTVVRGAWNQPVCVEESR